MNISKLVAKAAKAEKERRLQQVRKQRTSLDRLATMLAKNDIDDARHLILNYVTVRPLLPRGVISTLFTPAERRMWSL